MFRCAIKCFSDNRYTVDWEKKNAGFKVFFLHLSPKPHHLLVPFFLLSAAYYSTAMPPSSSSEGEQKFGAVRQEINIDALQKYLTGNDSTSKVIKTPVSVKQAAFGQSNPTMLLTDANGAQFILRKKPPGKLVSKTAHAVEREFKIIQALGKFNDTLPGGRNHSKAVPVPSVYCLCEDSSILGTPFYIMEFVKGRIFTDVRMLSLPKEERRRWWVLYEFFLCFFWAGIGKN